jgi:NitT/TauT family transport system permease protein
MKKAIQFIAPVVGALILWQIAAMTRFIDPAFFPPPTRVATKTWELLVNGEIPTQLRITLGRVVAAFFIGIVPGVLLGLLMGWVKWVRIVFDPIITVIYPVPRIAILPLFLVIFGIGHAPVIAATALIAFFPAALTTYSGVAGLDKNLPLMARNAGASTIDVLRTIAFPASLPVMLAGLRLALGVALTGLVAAEFVASQDGLGARIWRFWQLYRLPEMWAYIVVVALIGIVLQFGLLALQRRLLGWDEEVDLLN